MTYGGLVLAFAIGQAEQQPVVRGPIDVLDVLVVVHAEGADALQLGKLQHVQDDAAALRAHRDRDAVALGESLAPVNSGSFAKGSGASA